MQLYLEGVQVTADAGWFPSFVSFLLLNSNVMCAVYLEAYAVLDCVNVDLSVSVHSLTRVSSSELSHPVDKSLLRRLKKYAKTPKARALQQLFSNVSALSNARTSSDRCLPISSY